MRLMLAKDESLMFICNAFMLWGSFRFKDKVKRVPTILEVLAVPRFIIVRTVKRSDFHDFYEKNRIVHKNFSYV